MISRSVTFLLVALAALGALALATATATAAPRLGAGAHEVDLRSVEGTAPHGTGYTVPLAAEPPEWYTPELHRQVLAAEGEPVAAPAEAPLPSEVGIRPGAWMIAPSVCTMNFVFDKSGALGIGTAGHCAEVGEEVVLLTVLPSNPDQSVLVNVGRTAISRDNGVGDDFALVEIRSELYPDVDPTTALIGGPCGEYYGSGPETVAHYGHGLAIGTGGTPRLGVALTWLDDAYGWDGAAIFGDSGSPVRVTDFKAAGNLTHLVVDPRFLPSYIAGTRIGRMLEIVNGWALADSSICPLGGGGDPGGGDTGSDDGPGNGNAHGRDDNGPGNNGNGNGYGRGGKKG